MTDDPVLRSTLDRLATAHRLLAQVRTAERDPTRARAAANRLLTEIEKLQKDIRTAVPRGTAAPA